ncbi:MAG: DNA replication and repair protein RecF [Gammaproteobacteria bacterium]|nr:DNA replication and repair protein RecF [Gammaproteobacteria bacterium]
MQISRLRAQNLRKIRSLEIAPSPQLNLIWGANGSGKTTLLEALHLLNSAKSFRSSGFKDLVTHQENKFGVSAQLLDIDGEQRSVRVQKSEKATRIEVDGLAVTSAATLAQTFPLLLVDPHSFGIVEGGPRIRRSLIDRAVFHVEPEFISAARSYLNGLAQRNALLKTRQRSAQLDYWNHEVVSSGERVHQARLRCVEYINSALATETTLSGMLGRISLKYRQGWREGASLLEALERQEPTEWQAGQTMSGPHKAELIIQTEGETLARVASRGQIKAVVFLLMTTLCDYIRSSRGIRPILMVDDFGAELDDLMLGLTLKMVRGTGAQAFLTTIHSHLARNVSTSADTLFHVEQGAVGPVS